MALTKALTRTFLLPRILGICCLRYSPTEKHLRVCYLSLAYNITVVLFFWIINHTYMKNGPRQAFASNCPGYYYLNNGEMYLSMCSVTITLNILRHISTLDESLRLLREVDTFLKKYSIVLKDSPSYTLASICLFINLLIFVLRMSLIFTIRYAFIIFIIYWPLVLSNAHILFFNSVLSLSSSRLAALLAMIHYYPRSSVRTYFLNELVRHHELLTRACDCIERVFSLPMFVISSSLYVMCIAESYAALCSCIYNGWNFQTLIKLFAIVMFALMIIQGISECNKISWQAKEFNTLLYQLMIDDKTNEILYNEKLRLHIAMKREVVFTACGFFNLDYTLVHSMIASATTYLVILIQFGQPSSSDTVLPTTATIFNESSTIPMIYNIST